MASGKKLKSNYLELKVADGPQQLLPADENREILIVQNRGSATVYLELDGDPSASSGFELAALGTLIIDDPAPTNSLRGVVASGTGRLKIWEG